MTMPESSTSLQQHSLRRAQASQHPPAYSIAYLRRINFVIEHIDVEGNVSDNNLVMEAKK